jgi:hypothetical protein
MISAWCIGYSVSLLSIQTSSQVQKALEKHSCCMIDIHRSGFGSDYSVSWSSDRVGSQGQGCTGETELSHDIGEISFDLLCGVLNMATIVLCQ